jgi:hypothetical protein
VRRIGVDAHLSAKIPSSASPMPMLQAQTPHRKGKGTPQRKGTGNHIPHPSLVEMISRRLVWIPWLNIICMTSCLCPLGARGDHLRWQWVRTHQKTPKRTEGKEEETTEKNRERHRESGARGMGGTRGRQKCFFCIRIIHVKRLLNQLKFTSAQFIICTVGPQNVTKILIICLLLEGGWAKPLG